MTQMTQMTFNNERTTYNNIQRHKTKERHTQRTTLKNPKENPKPLKEITWFFGVFLRFICVIVCRLCHRLSLLYVVTCRYRYVTCRSLCCLCRLCLHLSSVSSFVSLFHMSFCVDMSFMSFMSFMSLFVIICRLCRCLS